MSKITKDLETEIELIKLDIKENEIVIRKYEKKVNREKSKEQRILLEFSTIEEVQEAYGYGEITEEEYNKFNNHFENIENKKSINEMFLIYLKKTEKQNKQTLKYLENELFKEELVEIARS